MPLPAFAVRHAPAALVVFGFLKALGTAAIAPFLGAPMWLALAVGAFWVAAPMVGAYWWRARRAPIAAAKPA